MIRIFRGSQPDILRKEGVTRTAGDRVVVQAGLAKVRRGKRKLSFDRKIYASAEVKSKLITMQHDKCCFCESKISHISYGDVEHFRPKAAWRSATSPKLSRPGYFWLAYDWDNLLFCCQLCNQREKRNNFPLEDEAARCIFPLEDVSCEKPSFINPSKEDPTKYIGFRGDTPFPINNCRRGDITIRGLGLRRKALRLRRAEALDKLKMIYDLSTGSIPTTTANKLQAKKLLKRYSSSNSEYSSAVNCAIKDGFRYV